METYCSNGEMWLIRIGVITFIWSGPYNDCISLRNLSDDEIPKGRHIRLDGLILKITYFAFWRLFPERRRRLCSISGTSYYGDRLNRTKTLHLSFCFDKSYLIRDQETNWRRYDFQSRDPDNFNRMVGSITVTHYKNSSPSWKSLKCKKLSLWLVRFPIITWLPFHNLDNLNSLET